jgi:hypothetical protein
MHVLHENESSAESVNGRETNQLIVLSQKLFPSIVFPENRTALMA